MSFKLTAKQVQANRMLAGPQRHFLLVGGSRSTKTFTFTRATMARAVRASESRHLILRFRANAARASVALDTLPAVRRLCFPQIELKEHRQDGFFELPNGSQIWIGGLDDKDRVEKILGNEYATIFLNECSQISYASALVARTRLAQVVPGLKQRAYYDLNPVGKTHWTNVEMIQGLNPKTRQALPNAANFAHMFMNPKDNPNLDPDYLAELQAMPERQRRRFYEGQYVDEIEGALWTLEVIEQSRITPAEMPVLRRIVVAVDPSGAKDATDTSSDEIGILVVGLGTDNRCYVLEDRSLRGSPAQWGAAAVKAFKDWGADRIIAEKNFGGEMVRYVIESQDNTIRVKVITASRGKEQRAEPISSLYEKGLVSHVGTFGVLEDQMTAFSTAGYTGEGSPDHADALVWAITELIIGAVGGLNIIAFMKQQSAAVQEATAKLEAAAAAGRKIGTATDAAVAPPPETVESPPPAASKRKGKKAKVKPQRKYSSFSEAIAAGEVPQHQPQKQRAKPVFVPDPLRPGSLVQRFDMTGAKHGDRRKAA